MFTCSTPSLPVPDSHYRQIVQSALGYAIVACDLQGRVTSWNEGARQILGWTESEMLGQTLHRFFTPQDVAEGVVEREMARAAEQGRATDERWHVRKDGTRFWASGELMRLQDCVAEARPTMGFVKILTNRTEQQDNAVQLRELNETLKDSEARLQMALDVGGMGAWQFEVATGRLRWWPGMDAIHGLAPGVSLKHVEDYYDLVHPDDRAMLGQSVRHLIANKGGSNLEYRVVWPDGSVHWLESRNKVLTHEGGDVWRLSGVCVDVTHRKRVESDLTFLADASAELAGLTDYPTTLAKIARLAVPRFADWCVVDLVRDDGVLERVASAHADPVKEGLARELFRRFPHPRSIVAGGPWKVLRTGQANRVAEMTDEILEREMLDPEHRALVRKVGLNSYLGVPLAVRGKLLGVIGFIIGQSGRRYTEQDQVLAQNLAGRAAVAVENANLLRALQHSDRAKDVFLATLAHELRNPLAPVWNGLAIIRQASDDPRRVQQVAGMIERQVGQLSRLVDDLLDVSRITTGKIELKKEATNLVSILHSAIETSRPHIEAGRHQLSIHLPDKESTELEADPVRLAQVFANLLNNAAKYTRPGGSIDVRVQAEPDGLSVAVRDNGAGIATEMLGKVFALFTQVTHPLQRSQGGLGIGLSLVDGLVKLHGGSVEARSEGLELGSEFIVHLPRGERTTPTAPVQQEGEVKSGKSEKATEHGGDPMRVLVVDDNQDAADTLAELLAMLGREVFVAHDGRSAVSKAAQFAPDVVLLDIGLPDINGYEVARRIRQLEGLKQPRLIALTGWGQDQDKALATEAGFDDHWTKPVDPARLEALSH